MVNTICKFCDLGSAGFPYCLVRCRHLTCFHLKTKITLVIAESPLRSHLNPNNINLLQSRSFPLSIKINYYPLLPIKFLFNVLKKCSPLSIHGKLRCVPNWPRRFYNNNLYNYYLSITKGILLVCHYNVPFVYLIIFTHYWA